VSKTQSVTADIYKYFLDYKEKENEFQLDGIVFKVFDSKARVKLGEKAHSPNWAIAIKFKPVLTTTKINNISWQIGTTGELTPVAELEPVELDGSTVSRCTLHNYGNVVDNKLYPGAVISLMKAGDIIPQVESIIKPSPNDDYKLDLVCPFCGGKLNIIDNLHIICNNINCTGTELKRLEKAIKTLDIKFWGGKTIDKIYKAGFKVIWDIFNPELFNRNALIATGRFKPGKSLDRIVEQIENINKLDLWKVIVLMGIPNIGEKMSIQIANKIAGIEYTYKGLQKDILENFEDGEYYQIELNAHLVFLENKGIEIIFPQKQKVVDVEKLQYYEMTGSPKPFFKTKEEFVDFAKNKKFEHKSLSKDCKFLFTNTYESTSSKMKKAKSLGVQIITYSDFLNMFKNF